MGYPSPLRDLGITLPLPVWTDSSAAFDTCSGQGLGKLRYLDTHTLWRQQTVRSSCVQLKKVHGKKNPADILTKQSISRDKPEKLDKLYDCEFRDGWLATAPATRTGQRGGDNDR